MPITSVLKLTYIVTLLHSWMQLFGKIERRAIEIFFLNYITSKILKLHVFFVTIGNLKSCTFFVNFKLPWWKYTFSEIMKISKVIKNFSSLSLSPSLSDVISLDLHRMGTKCRMHYWFCLLGPIIIVYIIVHTLSSWVTVVSPSYNAKASLFQF